MTQTNQTAAEAKEQPDSTGGIKETLESILVAFILAFIFRAFVVEAFVIPTGSMAPTLLGAHMRFVCKDCGYPFDVSYNTDGEDMNIPARAKLPTRVYCPNCGYEIPATSDRAALSDASYPRVRYGDRILVLKYLYLLQDPKRWDVVVFKSPVDPATYDYSQNYIKRLVGLPGETLMILDGNLYVSHRNVPMEQLRPEDFTIQTKPPEAQEALWRIVYNNDYHPQGLDRDTGAWDQPWQPTPGSTGWKQPEKSNPAGDRVFRFADKNGSGTLQFSQTDGGGRQTHALSDWLAYDQASQQQPESRTGETVNDLKMSLIYTRQEGSGPLRLKLSNRDDIFVAEIGPTSAQLLHGKAGEEPRPLGQRAELPRTSSLKLDFINVDYQVTLKVNGTTLLQTTPDQYRPDVAALLANVYQSVPMPTVQIEADRQVCEVAHLSLWRDVYYLSRSAKRASPLEFPTNLVRLSDVPGKKEYFVLGDNSLMSLDARYWDAPIHLPQENLDVAAGRVPERFLLGKAFFVYWPAGYPPVEAAPSIVPNFGEMRFIH